MAYRSKHCDVRTFLLYVDSYENDIPKGHYYSPDKDESGSFCSMTQLLLSLEKSMEEEKMIRSFQRVCMFPSGTEKSEEKALEGRADGRGTFSVQILFRRNASWQGSVSWLEGKKTMPFRSVLELIHLMHSAMHRESQMAWMESKTVYLEMTE